LLADKRSDDLFRHRLTLAVLCLPEIKLPRKTWRLSRLVDRITTDAFRLWWDHHTRSLSKHAAPVPAVLDHVLPALGQVNGRVNRQPLLELICRYLRSEDKDEQATAVEIIGRIGSVATTADPCFLDRLTGMLQTEDKWVAIPAIINLGSAAATTPILTELVQMLQDEERDELTCAVAGNALGQMPLDTDSGVRAIILNRLAQVIQDPNSSVWFEIIENVRRILGLNHKWDSYLDGIYKGRTKAEALARLLDDLLQGEWYEEEAEEEREEPKHVTEPTLLFNDFFPITLDELTRKLESKDWSERSRAIRAVCKNGAQAASEDILDRLMEILQSPDSGIAVTPVILEQLSFEMENPNWGTEEYTPTILMQALSNRMPLYKAWSVAIVAVSSTEYVRRMVPQGPPDGLNRLAQRLGGKAVFTEEHFGDLNQLAQLLQESGPSAFVDEAGGIIFTQLRVLGLLSSLVFERSAAVMAIRILRDAAAESPDIIERLSRMLAHEHYEVWCAAAMAIVGIGREAATQPVLRQVAQMLEDENWLKRHAAAIMLMGIGREFANEPSILEGVLDRLEQMLAHPNWLERYAALVAVASIGSAATRPQIITPIVEMLGDAIPSVRVAAAGALGEMKQSGVYFFVTRDGIKIKEVPELSAV
jgi:HEAT repeat protein